MILVHLPATWPDVLADRDTPERATLEAWAQITDDALATYGDAILGIYQNEVVTAFEIDDWDRNEDGRVVFSGHPSDRFRYLIGTPNPAGPGCGARPGPSSTSTPPSSPAVRCQSRPPRTGAARSSTATSSRWTAMARRPSSFPPGSE